MNDKKKGANDALRYSSVGVQMVLMICLCTWLGTKLDVYFDSTRHLFTAGMALFGVIASMIYILRVVGGNTKKPRNKNIEPKDKNSIEH